MTKEIMQDIPNMKQIESGGKHYIELAVNTSILLNDNQLERMYNNFHLAKAQGLFSGSFSDFCTLCFTLGANVYLLKFSDIVSMKGGS